MIKMNQIMLFIFIFLLILNFINSFQPSIQHIQFVGLSTRTRLINSHDLKSFPREFPSLTIQRRSSFHNRNYIVMMGQRGKRIKKDIKKEKQMETPPRIPTPYGPIRMMRPLTMCDVCIGRGVVKCNVCEGVGLVRATGQRKRNTVNIDRIVGSRWTSVEIRCGHRHYVCDEIKGSRKKKNLSIRMTNSCGPEEERVNLWIEEEELKNKFIWRAGWITLEEIINADKGPLLDEKVCFRCKGDRIIKCAECDGKGKLGFNQVLYD